MSELIYGKNAVLEALKANNREIIELFIQDNINNNDQIIILAKEKKIKYKLVNKEFLNKKVNGLHQGVVMVLEDFKYYELDDLISNKKYPLIVALDGLEDPHNLGAILRTCEASGVDGVVLPKNRSVKLNNTVAKVSTGAIFLVKVCEVVNLQRALKKMKEKGYWIVGAEYDEKSVYYTELSYDMPVVLVIGSEGKGLSRIVKEECDYLVKIPMFGQINSLNASVSTGIMIYEIRRQQR